MHCGGTDRRQILAAMSRSALIRRAAPDRERCPQMSCEKALRKINRIRLIRQVRSEREPAAYPSVGYRRRSGHVEGIVRRNAIGEVAVVHGPRERELFEVIHALGSLSLCLSS